MNMHAMKVRGQAMRAELANGRQQCWGVTAERLATIQVMLGGVTAGKLGRNSSVGLFNA